jgi:hypothetical protein
MVPSPFSLSMLPAWSTDTEMRPQTFPQLKINLRHSGLLTAPSRAVKGEAQMYTGSVGAKGARRRGPEETNPAVETDGGLGSRQDKAQPPSVYIKMPWTRPNFPPGQSLSQCPARYPLVGCYFVVGLAFSLRWREFPTITFLGLPKGFATAGANALVMANIVA